MIFRDAIESDLQTVTDIENKVMTMPWSFCSFSEAKDSKHTIFKVAEEDGQIAGYAIVYVTAPDSELPDIVVSEEFRRRGVAQGLLDEVIAQAKSLGVSEMFLEVRQNNDAARQLYLKNGFTEIGIRENFYRDPVEDAICMRADI